MRTLLEAYQMNPSEVAGTGPHGLLTKGDVLQVIKQKGLTAKPPKQGMGVNLGFCQQLKLYYPFLTFFFNLTLLY